MKIFEIKINEESFQVKAKEIFTASKRAIDLYHERRKLLGRRKLIPKHIELLVNVRHEIHS